MIDRSSKSHNYRLYCIRYEVLYMIVMSACACPCGKYFWCVDAMPDRDLVNCTQPGAARGPCLSSLLLTPPCLNPLMRHYRSPDSAPSRHATQADAIMFTSCVTATVPTVLLLLAAMGVAVNALPAQRAPSPRRIQVPVPSQVTAFNSSAGAALLLDAATVRALLSTAGAACCPPTIMFTRSTIPAIKLMQPQCLVSRACLLNQINHLNRASLSPTPLKPH